MKIARAKYLMIGMSAGGALCVGATLLFLLLPALKDANALAESVRQAQTELESQYANRKQLSNTADRLAAAQASLKKLSAQFVAPGEELAFITAIEDLSDKNGVTSKLDLGADAPAVGGAFNRAFNLSIDGTFRNAMNMLVDLERMPYLTVLNNVEVRGSGGQGDQTPLSITLSGQFSAPPQTN